MLALGESRTRTSATKIRKHCEWFPPKAWRARSVREAPAATKTNCGLTSPQSTFTVTLVLASHRPILGRHS
jgi:hypothetical protein